MFSLILYRISRSKRSVNVSWNRFLPSIVPLMLNFFFEPFDFLSQTHYFKEEKHITVPNELAYFLRDCLFADFVSNLAGYFFRKDFFWIHANRDQIDLREDNRYESKILIQNLCQPDNNTGTSKHRSSRRLNDLLINACKDYEGN